jgi:hypothetical protein
MRHTVQRGTSKVFGKTQALLVFNHHPQGGLQELFRVMYWYLRHVMFVKTCVKLQPKKKKEPFPAVDDKRTQSGTIEKASIAASGMELLPIMSKAFRRKPL